MSDKLNSRSIVSRLMIRVWSEVLQEPMPSLKLFSISLPVWMKETTGMFIKFITGNINKYQN